MRTTILARPLFAFVLSTAFAASLVACGDDSDSGPSADTTGGSTTGDTASSNTTVNNNTTASNTTASTSPDTTGTTTTPEDNFDDYFEDDLYMLPDSHANIVRQLDFLGEEDGVVAGFDLDNTVSADGDPESCGHGDLVSPDGVEGIDNQLAVIWPSIEPIVGTQIRGLLQGAINEGRILIVFELEGVDDLRNDDTITIHVARANLDPVIGTFGLIAPDQTFYINYDHPISTTVDASIVDGELIAGPVAIGMPIDILDARFTMHIPDALVRATIHDDGSMEGYIGGSINVPDILEELYNTGGRAEASLVGPVFEANTDLGEENGVCDRMSVGIRFESTTAFLVRDAAAEP